MMWIAEILFVFAAIFKAVADTVDHHFGESKFRNLNPKFWDRDISQDRAKKIFGYKVDAWHLFNSGMIGFFIAAASLHKFDKLHWYWWAEIGIGGIVFVGVFNTFYNKILR